MPRFLVLCLPCVALNICSLLPHASAHVLKAHLDEGSDSLRLRGRTDSVLSADKDIRKNIVAIYMNMPDRPERRQFAESQFHALGLHALRVEGTALPNKKVAPSYTWLRAVDACIKQSAPLCLLSEDDAVFRPVDREERHQLGNVEDELEESSQEEPWLVDDALNEDDGGGGDEKNVTANPPRFFAELNSTLTSLPGGLNGQWDGLHLCAVGELESVGEFGLDQRFEGNPWPNEKFTSHMLYSGAPGVLLLRRSRAKLYHSKLQALMESEKAKHLEHPMDVLQPMLYRSEDSVGEHDVSHDHLKVFMAARPQLCQHLADMTTDPRYLSSRPEFANR